MVSLERYNKDLNLQIFISYMVNLLHVSYYYNLTNLNFLRPILHKGAVHRKTLQEEWAIVTHF